MTREEIDDVLNRVCTWPLERQEDVAEMLLFMEKMERGVYVLSPEELADIREGLAECDRGEFVSDEEVEALQPVPQMKSLTRAVLD
jgi:hypothetical protein